MGLINCKACGHQVSSGAKACPNCGHVLKQETSGCAMLVALAIFVPIMLAIVGKCTGPADDYTPASSSQPVTAIEDRAPAGKAEIVTFNCGQNSAYYSAEITIRNIGTTAIEFPRVFVKFDRGGSPAYSDDAPISPRPLPPGATGTAKVIAQDSDGVAYQCSIMALQNGDGISIL